MASWLVSKLQYCIVYVGRMLRCSSSGGYNVHKNTPFIPFALLAGGDVGSMGKLFPDDSVPREALLLVVERPTRRPRVDM